MLVKVDHEKCIGCGVCESLCEECFKVSDGKANFLKASAEECACNLDDVISACPEAAISKV